MKNAINMHSNSPRRMLKQLRIAYFIAILVITLTALSIGFLCTTFLTETSSPSSQFKAAIEKQLQPLKAPKRSPHITSISAESEYGVWKYIVSELNNDALSIEQCTVFKNEHWHAHCLFTSKDNNKKESADGRSSAELFNPLLGLNLFGHATAPPTALPKPMASPETNPAPKSWLRLDSGVVKHYDETLGQWR